MGARFTREGRIKAALTIKSGNSIKREIKRVEAAIKSLKREDIFDDDTLETKRSIISIHSRLGYLYHQVDSPTIETNRKAIEHLKIGLTDLCNSSQVRKRLYIVLGEAYARLGNKLREVIGFPTSDVHNCYDQALGCFSGALKLSTDSADEASILRQLGIVHQTYADTYRSTMFRTDVAHRAAYEKSMCAHDDCAIEYFSRSYCKRKLLSTLSDLEDVFEQRYHHGIPKEQRLEARHKWFPWEYRR